MDVLPLTLLIGLCLALTLIVFFWREQARRRLNRLQGEPLLSPSSGVDDASAPEPMVIDIAAAAAARRARQEAAAQGHSACQRQGHHHHHHHDEHAHEPGKKEECRGNGSCNTCERRKSGGGACD